MVSKKSRIAGLSLFMIVLLTLPACVNRKNHYQDLTPESFLTVDVNMTRDFFDASFDKIQPDILFLDEEEDAMLADFNRILDCDGLYFLLDRYCARRVVSFTHDGKPFATYGAVGQGPGEYVFPQDFDVWNDKVYVLDSNSKKINTYSKSGVYISKIDLPFYADAFKILDDGKIIFNLTAFDSEGYSLCLADSTISSLTYMLPYPKGYRGGLQTSDVFRKSNGRLTYYKAPSDTLYLIDENGLPNRSISFDFKTSRLPDDAKLDFSTRNRDASYLWWVNAPIYLNKGLWFGLIEDGHQQFSIIFSEKNGNFGAVVFDSDSSVYDPIEPFGCDNDGNLICILNYDIAIRCADYNSLSNDVKCHLENDETALLIYK